MDLKRAELKVALRKADIEDFDIRLEQLKETQKEVLMEGEGGIEDKNEVSRKLRNTRARNAFIKTALIGGTIGTVFQETKALFDDSQDGVIEGTIKHFTNKEGMVSHGTALEALRRYFTGEQTMMKTDALHGEIFAGSPTHVEMPDGVTFEQNPDTTYNMLRDGKVISENIPVRFDDQGNLSTETQEALSKSGITSTFGLVGEKTTQEIHESVDDYVKNHGDEMRRVHRELWYDKCDHRTHLIKTNFVLTGEVNTAPVSMQKATMSSMYLV